MDDDRDPIICPCCGGTGLHPWMQAACRECDGTGTLTDDVYDDRYKIQVYRAHHGCFES